MAYQTVEREELIAEGWRPFKDEVLNEEILLCPPVPLEFVHHPKAPMFDDLESGRKLLNNLITEMTEDPENFQFTDEVLEIYRQASLVSLWFFLKFVAGFSGPYNDLNDSLHIDMCNYRQRQLQPGARGAFFIFRSGFKSTIATHGANAWEILRDPDIRIGMVSSKVEMAQMFMYATMRIFDSNELIAILFPEFVPEKNADGVVKNGIDWTNKQFTIPARTRKMPEPTMKCAGAAGSTQGIHCDLLSIDDVVGEKQLNAYHEASDEMIKITNWVKSNVETLLISPKYSRVFLAATRYSLDDPYEHIMWDAYEHIGNWDEVPYQINPDGVWSVYYRQAVERGRLTFPEKISFKFLKRLKETNYWGYITQYMNNAHAAELSEFSSYQIKEASLDYQTGRGYRVTYKRDGVPYTQPLSAFEVTLGIDPAASSRRESAKTSRTAIVVVARDSHDVRVYIDGAVGYFTTVQFYDNIFRLYRKYKDYVKSTCFEAGGAFKFVYDTLLEEQRKRNIFLGLRKSNPLPDKDGKIRNFFQPLLEKGLVAACQPIRSFLLDELRTFPGGNLKDTLDACEIANRYSVRPLSQKEINERNNERHYREGIRNRAGW